MYPTTLGWQAAPEFTQFFSWPIMAVAVAQADHPTYIGCVQKLWWLSPWFPCYPIDNQLIIPVANRLLNGVILQVASQLKNHHQSLTARNSRHIFLFKLVNTTVLAHNLGPQTWPSTPRGAPWRSPPTPLRCRRCWKKRCACGAPKPPSGTRWAPEVMRLGCDKWCKLRWNI